MNTEPNNTNTALVKAPETKPQKLVVHDESGLSNLLDTARFEHCYRIAQGMAAASLLPTHLRGDKPEITAANCFLIVNQSLRWGLDPFTVAPETYCIQGKLGYQGKLIAAVVNKSGRTEAPLDYTYTGKGDDLEITVSATIKGEAKPREVRVKVRDVKTANKMWTADPEQKLVYTGAIKWARRHMPEVILGVLTDDDGERMQPARTTDETPSRTVIISEPEVIQPESTEAK